MVLKYDAVAQSTRNPGQHNHVNHPRTRVHGQKEGTGLDAQGQQPGCCARHQTSSFEVVEAPARATLRDGSNTDEWSNSHEKGSQRVHRGGHAVDRWREVAGQDHGSVRGRRTVIWSHGPRFEPMLVATSLRSPPVLPSNGGKNSQGLADDPRPGSPT